MQFTTLKPIITKRVEFNLSYITVQQSFHYFYAE